MRILLILLALAATLAPRAMAQSLPDLGDGAGGILPPLVERKIGESIIRDIRQRDPAYLDDPEIADYLNELGARLSAAVPGGRQDFEFIVIRDSSINAFALPGGFIGAHTGLVLASESESEVASVLAHEMAHVTQRHIARMLGAQQQVQLPVMIAMAAALLLGRSRPDLAQAAAMAAQGAVVQTQLGYSRDYEREADRIGFQTLSGAGFDGHAMASFFERLQRYTRIIDDGTVPGYLRTHPVTTERIADAQARAANQPYRQHPDSTEYHLVRAKLRAEAGEARDAVTHFRAAVRDRRFANEPAASYGLVVALLRANQPREAAAELARLQRGQPDAGGAHGTGAADARRCDRGHQPAARGHRTLAAAPGACLRLRGAAGRSRPPQRRARAHQRAFASASTRPDAARVACEGLCGARPAPATASGAG